MFVSLKGSIDIKSEDASPAHEVGTTQQAGSLYI